MADTQPVGKPKTYPILGKIAADIRLDTRGNCAMPTERFHFWGRHLTSRYPRRHHLVLYEMLGGMMLEFAKQEAFASVQLYALATLGLTVEKSQALAKKSDYVRTESDRADTVKIKLSKIKPTASQAARMRGLEQPGGSGVSGSGTVSGAGNPWKKTEH